MSSHPHPPPAQVDAIMRLSEAHARLHLNDFVRESDVDMAIRIIVSSFVETQKFSVAKQVSHNCVH
jgi:DNA replication licensing factor MCM2